MCAKHHSDPDRCCYRQLNDVLGNLIHLKELFFRNSLLNDQSSYLSVSHHGINCGISHWMLDVHNPYLSSDVT
jgi:hypothetical protein